MDRMTSATSSFCARSSHTNDTIVMPSPTSTNWTDRRGYVDRLPPADVGVKRASKVVLSRSGVRRATSDGACPGECETTIPDPRWRGPPFSSLGFTPICI